MEEVRVERHAVRTKMGEGVIGELVLNRPGKRNAMTEVMLGEVLEGMDALERDRAVGAMVVLEALLRGLGEVVRRVRRSRLVAVCGVERAAVAGGCALAMACDYVVVDGGAKLGYPVLGLGISPAVSGGVLRWRVGSGWARRLLLGGEMVDGVRARELGMADRVVDLVEDVTPRAQLEAGGFAAKPRGAMAATKGWLNEIDGMDDAGWRACVEASVGVGDADGARERVAEALERRAGGAKKERSSE